MEGILMRGPKKQAVVCRTADGLVEKVEDLKLLRDKYPIFGWPFIRGIVTFLDSMIKGMGALLYSAELLPEELQEDDPLDKWIEAHFSAEKAKQVIIYTAVVLGIGLSLFLFVFLPTFLVGFIRPIFTNFFLRNLTEGLVRIALLIAYMGLTRRVPDVAPREPFPSPLRHQLSSGGGAGERAGQLGCEGDQHLRPDRLPPAASAGGGGHQL